MENLEKENKKLQMQVASLHGVIAGTAVGTYTPEQAVAEAEKIMKEGMSKEQLAIAEEFSSKLKGIFDKLGIDPETMMKGIQGGGHEEHGSSSGNSGSGKNLDK